MGEVRVGRFEILDFVAPNSGGEGDRVRGDVPRFTVTVLDATHSATRCSANRDSDRDRDGDRVRDRDRDRDRVTE